MSERNALKSKFEGKNFEEQASLSPWLVRWAENRVTGLSTTAVRQAESRDSAHCSLFCRYTTAILHRDCEVEDGMNSLQGPRLSWRRLASIGEAWCSMSRPTPPAHRRCDLWYRSASIVISETDSIMRSSLSAERFEMRLRLVEQRPYPRC